MQTQCTPTSEAATAAQEDSEQRCTRHPFLPSSTHVPSALMARARRAAHPVAADPTLGLGLEWGPDPWEGRGDDTESDGVARVTVG